MYNNREAVVDNKPNFFTQFTKHFDNSNCDNFHLLRNSRESGKDQGTNTEH